MIRVTRHPSWALFVPALVAFLAGCPDKKSEGTAPTASASGTTAASTTAPAVASADPAGGNATASIDEPDEPDLDSPTDDEDLQRSAGVISKTNYKSELDKLEHEDLKK